MWDIAIDPETGDFMFDPTRDLLGVTSSPLTDQRILTRCKIPRGTFTYDEDGSLGSRLHSISGAPIGRQIREAPALVQEAIEGMTDIHITSIDTQLTDDERVVVIVNYSPAVQSVEGEIISAPPTTFDARVTI